MSYKNLIEDIVKNSIESVLNDSKLTGSFGMFFDDIAAYVLNRIPPKYVTGERGILHGKLDSKIMFQQKADIIMYTYEAIEVIKKRRNESVSSKMTWGKNKMYFFPHIMGEVLEETTFSIVSEVVVTLLHKGQLAKMVDSSWENPYVTKLSTKSYYHFWPDVDEETMDLGKKEEVFEIKFSHPNFEEKKNEIVLPITGAFDFSKSKAVPIALLSIKDGKDASFLYELS